MGKSEEKVYCRECVYVRTEYGTNVYRCSHKDNKTERHTPLEILYEQMNVVECNANNDCKLYEEDPKPEILRAFHAVEDKRTLDGFVNPPGGGISATDYYAMPNGLDFIEVYHGRAVVITKEAYMKAKERSLKEQLRQCQEKNSEKASEQTTEKSLDVRKCWLLFWRKR